MLDRQRLWLLELRTELKTVHFNISIFSPSRGLNCLTSETELAFDNCVARLGNILVFYVWNIFNIWSNNTCLRKLPPVFGKTLLLNSTDSSKKVRIWHLIFTFDWYNQHQENNMKVSKSKVPDIPVVTEWKINIWLAFPKNIKAQRNMKLVLVYNHVFNVSGQHVNLRPALWAW